MSSNDRPSAPTPAQLQRPKVRMIDMVAERGELRTVADIGGVWKVEGGYARHAFSLEGVERVQLVDLHMSDDVRAFAAENEGFDLVEADMGSPDTPDLIGDVDLVLLYDVLLHQANPDWDEILTRYSARAGHVAVAGPRWGLGTDVVRLPDLGRERYRAIVPASPDDDLLFDRPDEWIDRYQRKRRDAHAHWQWGIPTAAISAKMTELGFATVGYEHHGAWFGSQAFTYEAAVFARIA